jgi:chromosome partitioning protein
MTITIGSLKGSVGKTTTALNLAVALQKNGRTVQLVDMDDDQYDLAEQAREAGLSCLQPKPDDLRRVIADNTSDYLLIECPPRMVRSGAIALTLSDVVIAPVVCEYLSVRGLGRMIAMVNGAKKRNPALKMFALPTMYASTHKETRQELQDALQGELCVVSIPRCKYVAAAPTHGQSVLDYNPKCRGSAAFRRLAKEVQSW